MKRDQLMMRFKSSGLKVISLESDYESDLTHVSDITFKYVLCHLNVINSCLDLHCPRSHFDQTDFAYLF